MNRETALRHDFRMMRARRVRIVQEYLHPEYRLVIPRKVAVSPTGHFVLFRLRPPKGCAHRGFWARWDNAVIKGKPGPAVKIELDHPSRRERLAFKRSLDGYRGHWTVPTSAGKDSYHIAVVDKGEPVLTGTLSLRPVYALDFSLLEPSAKVQICATEDDTVIAEMPWTALGPTFIKFARLEKRLRKQGRSKRVAFRLAMLASPPLPESAITVYRPDLLPRRRYTKAEKRIMIRRVARRLGIPRAEAESRAIAIGWLKSDRLTRLPQHRHKRNPPIR
jgi:hypothetical protein